VPHDQQLTVASSGACPGMINEDLNSGMVVIL
jgi:hypothetical protein